MATVIVTSLSTGPPRRSRHETGSSNPISLIPNTHSESGHL